MASPWVDLAVRGRKHLGRPRDRRVDAVIDARTISGIDVEREKRIDQIFVQPPPPGRHVGAVLEYRLLDLKIARFAELFRKVDDKKICKQEVG